MRGRNCCTSHSVHPADGIQYGFLPARASLMFSLGGMGLLMMGSGGIALPKNMGDFGYNSPVGSNSLLSNAGLLMVSSKKSALFHFPIWLQK
jgi:hypothetical protein